MERVLLASTNPGKLAEMRALVKDLAIELVTPDRLGLDLKVLETGSSYAENATLKASHWALASGLWSLADDSGLEVDVLGGRPGLYSARIAGEGRTDADRRAVLLAELEGHPQPWKGRFVCVMALARPGGRVDLATGVCPGQIIPQARGQSGFGYDPIFLVEGQDKTMAEIPMAQKNRLSHRARAFAHLRPVLVDHLGLT